MVAKQLLAKAGYPDGRDRQSGKPLLINLDVTGGGPEDKARFDWLRKQFKKIDLELVIRNTDYNRFQEKMRTGNAQLFMWGWNADYPDPENFMFLLYGPNGKVKHGGENAANYDNPEFNRLFDKMKNMENSPTRFAIIQQMTDIARRDGPWLWGMHPKQFALIHSWYKNVKPNLMAHNTLMYRRIDPQLREQKRREWNRPLIWPVAGLLLVLLLSIVPGVIVYRRKEQQVVRDKASL
jgi:oligopeptide transport system substrate-binding protein